RRMLDAGPRRDEQIAVAHLLPDRRVDGRDSRGGLVQSLQHRHRTCFDGCRRRHQGHNRKPRTNPKKPLQLFAFLYRLTRASDRSFITFLNCASSHPISTASSNASWAMARISSRFSFKTLILSTQLTFSPSGVSQIGKESGFLWAIVRVFWLVRLQVGTVSSSRHPG